MCGIFGRFAPAGELRDRQRLCRATETLAHRGPDGGGFWEDPGVFLGHRRLAIIDLDGGRQPLASWDERFVIIFNGEIYNYVEVRAELVRAGARFTTRSDTEVIIEAYRKWGLDALQRLAGMFAFALFDRKERSLLLARDRFGEKPLFYSEGPAGGVTFASELKAIVVAGATVPEIDVEALEGYLTLNYVPGTSTMLRDVRRLAPGHWRLYGPDGSIEAGRYWAPPDPRSAPLEFTSEADAVPELRRRFDDAVKIALRSDVPVTLFLSGGIDSSLVAESAVRQGMIGTAYCLDFEDESYSEWENAQAVADRLGIELRRAVATVPDPDIFARIAAHLDDPLADSSAVAVWHLSECAARDFKVVITGDGGDELFAGYLTYQATEIYSRLYRVLPRNVLGAARWLAAKIAPGDKKVTSGYKLQRFLRAFGCPPSEAHFTWNGTWMPAQARGFIAPGFGNEQYRDPLAELVRRYGLPPAPCLRELQTADALEYLPNDILVKVDRVTMAHGLESRAPFLNHEVAEFGLRLPEHLKLFGGKPKRILRALADETFGPEISRAKKQGFSIPVHRWLRGPMRESLEAYLGSSALAALPFIEASAVTRAVEQHLAGRAQLGFELWGLMVLSTWWKSIAQFAAADNHAVGGLEQIRLREFT